MYYYIFKSIRRQKSRSILVVLVNFVLVVLLNLYFGLIGSYWTQLNDLAANTPIKCTVTNPDGTIDVGIVVESDCLRALQAAEQIKELDFSTQLKAGFGEFKPADWEEHLNLDMSVVNKIDSTVLPDHIMVNYQEGWDETLFARSEKVCILRKSDMEKNGYACGDEVTFTVYYYLPDDTKADVDIFEFGCVQLKVVGEIDDSDPTEALNYPDVLVPFRTVWEEFEERNVDFTADAVSFYVRNPLEINAFKAEMEEIGFMEIYKGGRLSYKGSALYVLDGTFITMAGRLKTAIRILTAFLVPMGVLVFIVGYVISHLLVNGRVREFALLRSLGIKQSGAVWVFWGEQLVLVFAGNLLGCLAALFIGQLGIREIMTVCGAAFCGYMLGTTVALLLLAKNKPLQLLASA